MTDGMRRPPRLWEQKLQGMIRAAGVTGFGSPSSSVVSPGPTPGPDGSGSEPAPSPVVDPDPSTPRIPSTPIVAGTTLGLSITWDGKDTAGTLFPKGTIVEVHLSASSGFTPSSGTLKGTITEAGGSLLVGGIAAGSTFYVKFIAVYADGQKSDPSAQGSAQVGLVQGPEINGDAVITQIVAATTPVTTYKLGSIWLNTSNGTYNVLESVGGTPTWVKREWDTAAIAANAITANQIAAQAITTKFLTGEIIRTGSSPSARIEISATNGIEVFRDATTRTFWAKPSGEVIFGTASVSAGGTTVINGDSITTGTINVNRLSVTPLTATDVGSGGTTIIDGGRITSGVITGRTIRTSSGVTRAVLGDGEAATLDFYYLGTLRGFITGYSAGLSLYGNPDVNVLGNLDVDGGINVSAAASDFPGVYNNNTTGLDSVGITSAGRLRRLSSSQEIKYDITPLSGNLSDTVESERVTDVVTVDPFAVLDVAVTEFSVIDRYFPPLPEGAEPGTLPPPPEPVPTERRVLGFIADDVAEKLPVAVTRDEDGKPAGVLDTAVVAALLAVVQRQQSVIADLETRIATLESNQG